MKYSDIISIWLKKLGFTHFFYVGGGNIMHLTESLHNDLIGVPVIHEVAAVIASEYFNVISDGEKKSLALVTAGPGLTNTITGISGAWLENRFILIIGGQVKTTDLKKSSGIRQRGIQEIDGVKLVKTITKKSIQIKSPISYTQFKNYIEVGEIDKKGPVFFEFPIDIQATKYVDNSTEEKTSKLLKSKVNKKNLKLLIEEYKKSKKPILLIGGGIKYSNAKEINNIIKNKKIPIMTTYNGADRIDGNYECYFGRPNTWGQRSSNILIQKSDLIIVFGSRLGLQQTGFNWKEFGRKAKIIHIDIDEYELSKGHPKTDFKIKTDCNPLLIEFLKSIDHEKDEWIDYSKWVRKVIPRIEKINTTGNDFISPYEFILKLESLSTENDIIIPCSSGSAFTLSMQLWNQKFGQRIITNKSLASMGYGLSGAIGASISSPNRRTILIEGDGGFAQNLQEIGTAKIQKLNLKVFIFDDNGHASIRMTQQNYFNGKYLGCDLSTGLGLPDWSKLFEAWNIRFYEVNRGFENDKNFIERFNNKKLEVFIVKIDPKQTYFPKISSRVTENGSMESNPIDKMTPEIDYLKK